jgi:uncharacterized protein (DUF1015 family)
MKNWKWFLGVVVILMFGYWSIDYIKLYNKGCYKFVFEADKDDAYGNLLFVEKVKGEKELNNLLVQFLSIDNRDLLTKGVAIRYIRENKKIEFLSTLKSVQKNFNSINPDSSWSVQIKPNRFRSAGLKDVAVVYDLNKTIDELNNK